MWNCMNNITHTVDHLHDREQIIRVQYHCISLGSTLNNIIKLLKGTCWASQCL